jgi:hypothetical protein
VLLPAVKANHRRWPGPPSVFNLGAVQLLAPARQLILSGKKKKGEQLTRKKLVIIISMPLQYCYTFRSNSIMSCVWLALCITKFCISGCSLAVAGPGRQSIHPPCERQFVRDNGTKSTNCPSGHSLGEYSPLPGWKFLDVRTREISSILN